MKKIISFLFILSFLYSNICYSQSGWFWQNPLPTSNTILKIKYLNSNFAMGVGDFGAVIKTTNGGNLWTCLQNFTSSNLKSLCILDSSKIYVVGADGSVYRTHNSGINWFKINLGTNTQFNDVAFLNSETGFIVGQGKILKTTNAGENWSTLDISVEIYNTCFINLNTGFLAGSSNTIYKTTNCGTNWTIINPEFGVYSWYSVYFKDENNGLIFGTGGKILKSTNGGLNWVLSSTNTSETILAFGIKDTNTLYAGGVNGTLLKTTNFGLNWTSLSSGQGSNMISSISVLNDTSICTLGWQSCPPCWYDILFSTNSGTNWNTQLQGVRTALNSVDFINAYTGVAVGSHGGILRTTNGGENWIIISSDLNYTYTDIQIFYSGIGYICGPSNFIQKTSNFGINWLRINLPLSGNVYTALSFLNENTGFVIGYISITFPAPGFYEPRVLKTTNGGISFTNLINGINTITLLDIKMIDENNVYIVGSHVFKSSNGGNNWISVFQSNYSKQSIYFHNVNTGVVGGGYKVIRTTNAGMNWQETSVPTNFHSISFFNEYLGIAVGYNYVNSGILKTVNGGITWQFSNGVTSSTLLSAKSVNQNIIYVVGEEGAIIKSTNGGWPIGINKGYTDIPSTFSLFQNYPNPFNPVTKIKYDIPPSKGARGMMTKLIIYDILGREIETLVNESQKPGSYEVTWDGSRYASGVYFYRLYVDDASSPQANPLSITKKMVLIK